MAEHWHITAAAIREALALATAAEGIEVQPLAVAVAGHGDGLYLYSPWRHSRRHQNWPAASVARSFSGNATPGAMGYEPAKDQMD